MMLVTYKEILLEGNAAIADGNQEGFLELCSEDIKWTFPGGRALAGEQAVRDCSSTS